MIIATENAVYLLEKDGSENKPSFLLDCVEVRRVVEGEKLVVVSLAENDIIILDLKEEKRIETGINDRIDSLCLVNEKPLDLLIGTTPPHIYRIN